MRQQNLEVVNVNEDAENRRVFRDDEDLEFDSDSEYSEESEDSEDAARVALEQAFGPQQPMASMVPGGMGVPMVAMPVGMGMPPGMMMYQQPQQPGMVWPGPGVGMLGAPGQPMPMACIGAASGAAPILSVVTIP
jgi:hypothetical protein